MTGPGGRGRRPAAGPGGGPGPFSLGGMLLRGLAPFLASASTAAAAMPAIGTYVEPWYTAREAYHWTFAPAADTAATATDHVHAGGLLPPASGESGGGDSCAGAALLFADVNGDGRDDNIRAGCGSAAG